MTGRVSVTGVGVVVLLLALDLSPWAGADGGKEKDNKTPKGAQGKDGWKALFDGKSLADWKSINFGGEGDVTVKDGAVILDRGNDMTGIVCTRGGLPKVDYEITLEGKRVAGTDFFCTTTFPVGSSHCSLVVGGWGGGVVGLSNLDGFDASMNETASAQKFDANRWYRVRIRVAKDRIEAWIDKDKVVDVETKGKKIAVRAECEPCRPFGIATWRTVGAVRDIRIRELTAAEKQRTKK